MSTTGELVRPHNLETVEMQTLISGRRFRFATAEGHAFLIRSATDTSAAARRCESIWS